MVRTLMFVLGVCCGAGAVEAAGVPIGAHVHGLAFEGASVTIATHDGLFAVEAGGPVRKLSDDGHAHPLAAAPEVGRRPAGLNGMSASPQSAQRVFAATNQGLMVTNDGGSSWATLFRRDQQVSAVLGTADGAIFAYAPGEGLVKGRDPATSFRRLGDPATGAPISHIAVDPQDSRRIAVLDTAGVVAISTDDGRTWSAWGRE